MANSDLNGFHAQAAAVLRSIHAENIMVLDAAGQVLLATDHPFGETLPKSWRASITDRTGSVVARTHDMENFLAG